MDMTHMYLDVYTPSMIDDMPRVGIRELRDNLKDYLEQVENGETIEITKNGRTIGMIVPKRNDNPTERLVAEGRLLPPRSGSGTIRLPRRVQPSPSSPSSGEALEELRADRQ
jgi:prevent-host-death family protein